MIKQKKRIPLFKVFVPKEAEKNVKNTLYSGFLAEGKKVNAFSRKISKYLKNPHVVLTNSCTMAITMAYKIAGVGPNTEVITTPLTCIAGNIPIVSLGAKPIWADICRKTGMVTAENIRPLITKKTRAIYILHKEGSPANLDEIYALKRYNNKIRIVEDAAHAFGAKKNNKKIGSFGDFICFSFQAIKHITTGDGGALLCGNKKDYIKAKKLKWFGIDRDNREGRNVWKEDIPEWGFKGNMNDIAASIGLSQMKYIDWILDKFHQNGRRYDEAFRKTKGIKILERNPNDFQTYWGYTILVKNRDKLIKALNRCNIESGQIHARNDKYSMFKSNKKLQLPNTDWFDKSEIAIPCGWWVSKKTQNFIIEKVKEAVS